MANENALYRIRGKMRVVKKLKKNSFADPGPMWDGIYCRYSSSDQPRYELFSKLLILEFATRDEINQAEWLTTKGEVIAVSRDARMVADIYREKLFRRFGPVLESEKDVFKLDQCPYSDIFVDVSLLDHDRAKWHHRPTWAMGKPDERKVQWMVHEGIAGLVTNDSSIAETVKTTSAGSL